TRWAQAPWDRLPLESNKRFTEWFGATRRIATTALQSMPPKNINLCPYPDPCSPLVDEEPFLCSERRRGSSEADATATVPMFVLIKVLIGRYASDFIPC